MSQSRPRCVDQTRWPLLRLAIGLPAVVAYVAWEFARRESAEVRVVSHAVLAMYLFGSPSVIVALSRRFHHTFGSDSGEGRAAIQRASAEGYTCVCVERSGAIGSFLMAVAHRGTILVRPFAMCCNGRDVRELDEPLVRSLPPFVLRAARRASLPIGWWRPPELPFSLAVVAVLNCAFNLNAKHSFHAATAALVSDICLTAALVIGTRLYWYARVDAVLRKLECEAATSRAQAPK